MYPVAAMWEPGCRSWWPSDPQYLYPTRSFPPCRSFFRVFRPSSPFDADSLRGKSECELEKTAWCAAV